jgi:hypothetical protein
MCVLIFSTTFIQTFIILIQRDMIKYVHWSSRKVPIIFVRF